MPCHAIHPIKDLFLESFSYELQFDMHFYMYSYLHKIFILVKIGCYMVAVTRLDATLATGRTTRLTVGQWRDPFHPPPPDHIIVAL
jgi:hypothetical protein